jgi:RNA recognition motif-containing protein
MHAMPNGHSPSLYSQSGRSDRQGSTDDNGEELIPTAIVIKNIPFAIKREQLTEVMSEMHLPLPYAFNYHFDNGVFRGLAFANFSSPEETAVVIEAMNHMELQGRKLRVEYKKMLPLQERERIEREKRERRGQLEEQHRPVGGGAQNVLGLHTQGSLSSLTSGVGGMPAPSPSPVSMRGPQEPTSTYTPAFSLHVHLDLTAYPFSTKTLHHKERPANKSSRNRHERRPNSRILR